MNKPTFFIIPTPIGNLKDITLRALEVLSAVDTIVCEDTRHTLKLLTHYQIQKPLISAEKHSEYRKAGLIVKLLEEGKSVAMVSDAGTPLISDPGSTIVTQVRQAGFTIEALPGACAFITALSASGFSGPVRFIGFFPRQKKDQEQEIMRMQFSPDHTVFYESPRRMANTLTLLHAYLKDREVCIAREITKLHEEYQQGTLAEVLPRYTDMNTKGEFTVLVKGTPDSKFAPTNNESIEDKARLLLQQGHSRKDVLKMIVEETGLARNHVYKLLMNLH